MGAATSDAEIPRSLPFVPGASAGSASIGRVNDPVEERHPYRRIEGIPDPTGRYIEVHARYGVAMASAQAMERALVRLVAVTTFRLNDASQTTPPADRETFEQLRDNLYTSTAGRVLARLRDVLDLPDEQDAFLRSVVRARNALAHHHFRTYTDLSGETPESIAQMQAAIDTSDAAMAMFANAVDRIHRWTIELMSAQNIDLSDVRLAFPDIEG